MEGGGDSSSFWMRKLKERYGGRADQEESSSSNDQVDFEDQVLKTDFKEEGENSVQKELNELGKRLQRMFQSDDEGEDLNDSSYSSLGAGHAQTKGDFKRVGDKPALSKKLNDVMKKLKFESKERTVLRESLEMFNRALGVAVELNLGEGTEFVLFDNLQTWKVEKQNNAENSILEADCKAAIDLVANWPNVTITAQQHLEILKIPGGDLLKYAASKIEVNIHPHAPLIPLNLKSYLKLSFLKSILDDEERMENDNTVTLAAILFLFIAPEKRNMLFELLKFIEQACSNQSLLTDGIVSSKKQIYESLGFTIFHEIGKGEIEDERFTDILDFLVRNIKGIFFVDDLIHNCPALDSKQV